MRRITLVKKVLEDGRVCAKCADVLARLERDGHRAAVDRIVVADAADPASEGMRLARRHGVDRAPFFVVEEGATVRVYTVYLRFVKEVLGARARERDELTELMALRPELDFI